MPQSGDGTDDIARQDQHDRRMREVSGWVRTSNITNLVQDLATYTGVRWDDADQDALDGLLPNTDAERPEGWFDYPIAGDPPLLLHLANDVGTDVVQVRVEGELSEVLAARFDTLFDVL